jgi:hypothetical protein
MRKPPKRPEKATQIALVGKVWQKDLAKALARQEL